MGKSHHHRFYAREKLKDATLPLTFHLIAIGFPSNWDVWHSENHWSNGDTMVGFIDKVLLPFVQEKRRAMSLEDNHPCLCIFDVFRGQQTNTNRT